MTIGTIKNVKPTGQGGYSVTLEEGLNALCFDKSCPSYAPGTKVEYRVEEKESKKNPGKFYKQIVSIHIPEEKPQGGLFNAGAGRDKDWQMFVTGVVGRACGSGKVEPESLEKWAIAAYHAFQAVNEIDKSSTHAKEMSKTSRMIDDEIPY